MAESVRLFDSQNCFLMPLEQFHPSGNKFFKLQPHLQTAREQGAKTLVTFGGPWSNHMYAVALMGKELGFRTVGVIRGEQPGQLSATLSDVLEAGMTLKFVSRYEYRRKGEADYLSELVKEFEGPYVIPEGGTSEAAISGLSLLADHIRQDFPGLKHLCVPVGTGGTLAGLAIALPEVRIHGFVVLKGEGDLPQQIEQLTGGKAKNWSLHSSHLGGYGKCPPELKDYIRQFETSHPTMLEPVYTAKMLATLEGFMKSGRWNEEELTLALHTGGMQGRRGFDLGD